MKQFLKKRWHRIPVALVSSLLVLFVVAGGVFAAYGFFHATMHVEVQEAIYPSYGEGDDLAPYMVGGGVLPKITFTEDWGGPITFTFVIEKDPGVDASEFLPGEELVLPINLRNRSDASFAIEGSYSTTGGVILEYAWEENTTGSSYKAIGSFADLDTFTTTLDPHSGKFGSAVIGADVLFVKVKALKDAAPGIATLVVNLTRE